MVRHSQASGRDTDRSDRFIPQNLPNIPRCLPFLSMQMCPRLTQQVDMTRQTSISSQEQRRAISPVAQMDRRALEE